MQHMSMMCMYNLRGTPSTLGGFMKREYMLCMFGHLLISKLHCGSYVAVEVSLETLVHLVECYVFG